MSKICTTLLAVAVHPEGKSPIYSELTTKIELGDEGAGLFVIISQETDGKVGQIQLDAEELLVVYAAAKMLLNIPQEPNL